MITIHLHFPDSPDIAEYAVYALADAEAVALPVRFYGQTENVILHLVNEIAYDAFRLAVAEGHILPENIRVRLHCGDTIRKGRINQYGVLIDPKDKDADLRFVSPGCRIVEQILLSTCYKLRAERAAAVQAGIASLTSSKENKL